MSLQDEGHRCRARPPRGRTHRSGAVCCGRPPPGPFAECADAVGARILNQSRGLAVNPASFFVSNAWLARLRASSWADPASAGHSALRWRAALDPLMADAAVAVAPVAAKQARDQDRARRAESKPQTPSGSAPPHATRRFPASSGHVGYKDRRAGRAGTQSGTRRRWGEDHGTAAEPGLASCTYSRRTWSNARSATSSFRTRYSTAAAGPTRTMNSSP